MCPPIGNKLLYVTSGHYAKYGKDAFQPIHTPEEGEEYFLKPMNCPHHCMIYKNMAKLLFMDRNWTLWLRMPLDVVGSWVLFR